MEKCSICKQEFTNEPHTQCSRCGAIVCLPCGAEGSQCPICGFNGKN